MKTTNARIMLNKVPEITLYFWIIKILCTTVGETFADFINETLGFGLRNTTIALGIVLAIALYFQFKSKKYIASIYWFSIVAISVFGTLVTDNLSDGLHVPLLYSTIAFSILLAATFVIWYKKEKTLSIHSIVTRRREIFYWLAILFTFALGTAVGDLIAETFNLGYLLTLGIFVAVTIVVAIGYFRYKWNPVLSFWIAYILTRPLGASIGDYLSQPHNAGGIGLGTTGTSIIFLTAILGTVIYLSVTKKDTVVQSKLI